MTLEILIQIFLFGIALSMDAFAVSVTDGLTYTDINKRRMFFIAGTFGVMQALMPLIGYWLVEVVEVIVGQTAGEAAGNIMATIVTWIAFALLMYIGGKMLIEAIKDVKKPAEEKEAKKFSVKEVLVFGVATAIDALATGVAFHARNGEGVSMSTNTTVWLHVTIIMVCTFTISLIGLFLGNKIEKLLKGKYEITGIIGGSILLILGIWIVLSHYLGI
ncbi:MAG: manganese efflux pump [Bacilli bacterium]|nr:manganese efflux pump [Bacilli bacterium]